MSLPHKPSKAATRVDRMMVRAIFLMLALLLHIQAIRFFSPQFAETSAVAKPPLVVQLKRATLPAAAPLPLPAIDAPAADAPAANQHPPPVPAVPPAARTLPEPSAPAAPSSTPEPFYHSPHALTRPPELVEDAPEEIELAESQAPGQLLLRLAIDRYGVVNGVYVLRSSLTKDLEGRVVLQFYRARYRPGEIDGAPVNSELLLVVNLQ